MDSFGELLDRVQRLTKLDTDEAYAVAKDLWDADASAIPTPAQIVSTAERLGYTVNATTDAPPNAPSIEDAMADMTDEEKLHLQLVNGLKSLHISADPAEVLHEVYMVEPRVLQAEIPVLGQAPDEAYQHFAAELADLPEDVIACLVKIDLFQGQATYWLRDEANNVDRPIGPIDLTRYPDATALSDALLEAFKRMPRVLAAEYN
jgi:hypothetical protein